LGNYLYKSMSSNIKEYGYNLKTGGNYGKHTEETKQRISEAGKRRSAPSLETREKIRLSKIGNQYGKIVNGLIKRN